MIGKTFRHLLAHAAAGALVLSANLAHTQESFFSIATGGVTGVYYPAGGAICRLVNQGRPDHGTRCFVEASDGSLANIASLREADSAFAVVQSDWHYHAYNGSSRFAGVGPFEALRSVFSIHAEPFTVVVRADSDVRTFEDIRGKRVNIGNTGSGVRGTMEVVMDAYGMTIDDFADAVEFPAVDQAQALCSGQIDVMIYTVGHPAAAISEVTTLCPARFVPLDSEVTFQLSEESPFYFSTTIPGGMYRGVPRDTPTFGVGATLVTTRDVPEAVVYTLTQAVFDDFDNFTNLHPALGTLQSRTMLEAGLTAPFHSGALDYYRERGWME